jgi:hypothetical protein
MVDRKLEEISRDPRRSEVSNAATDHLIDLISAFLGDLQDLDLLCEICAFVSEPSADQMVSIFSFMSQVRDRGINPVKFGNPR